MRTPPRMPIRSVDFTSGSFIAASWANSSVSYSGDVGAAEEFSTQTARPIPVKRQSGSEQHGAPQRLAWCGDKGIDEQCRRHEQENHGDHGIPERAAWPR